MIANRLSKGDWIAQQLSGDCPVDSMVEYGFEILECNSDEDPEGCDWEDCQGWRWHFDFIRAFQESRDARPEA